VNTVLKFSVFALFVTSLSTKAYEIPESESEREKVQSEIYSLYRSPTKDYPKLCEPAFSFVGRTCESLFQLIPRVCWCSREAEREFKDIYWSSISLCKDALGAQKQGKSQDDEIFIVSEPEMTDFFEELRAEKASNSSHKFANSCERFFSLTSLNNAQDWIKEAGERAPKAARDMAFLTLKRLKYHLCKAQRTASFTQADAGSSLTDEEKEKHLYCGSQHASCLSFCKLSQARCEDHVEGVWKAPSKCMLKDKARFMELGSTYFKQCQEMLGMNRQKEEL